MKLAALIKNLPQTRVIGDASVDVGRVRDDSRQVEPGDVFVAVRGLKTDGHAYIDDVVARGAAAVVVEKEIPDLHVAQVVVPDGAEALGQLAASALGCPGDRLGLVGVTGTNGKTTTSFVVEAILNAAGQSPGVIGTVSYRFAGQVKEAPYTTPTPLVLHAAFAEFAGAGCSHGVMEVSSVALSMNRLAGVRFAVAAFTNLTQDHLDMHGSMEEYRKAKELLFSRHLADDGVAVINIDDPAASHMIAAAGARHIIRVSAAGATEAEVRVLRADSSAAGIDAEIATPRGVLRVGTRELIGGYNVANLAMAVAIGEALGLEHEAVCRGIAAMTGVPGRVERVANDRGLDMFVDYAHTPDALRNVLGALKPLARRLICVFGCGGDRDPGKRPLMGAAVAELADLVVVTSDNPRTEDPRAIIDMILPAVPEPFFVHVDRRIAIQAAVCEATPGDIVLIAGKGHEDYQIIGTTKSHFDDREEAARAAAMRWDFSLADILEATGGEVVHAPAGSDAGAARFARVVIDSRVACPGDVYVAIRGERFDGHDFCAAAVQTGATAVIIEHGEGMPHTPEGAIVDAYVIAVPVPAVQARTGGPDGVEDKRDDVYVDGGRRALAAIARLHRRRFGHKPVIGVTGSSGKTTTKGLIAAALGSLGPVHATAGSLNNETGVPLTLLGLKPYHAACVVEMGMRVFGDIDYLVAMVEPSIGVVVNAGIAHVGVAGDEETILRGKAQMFGRLGASGTAVMPAEDRRFVPYAEAAGRRITFGRIHGADVRVMEYRPRGAEGADLVLQVAGEEFSGHIALAGEHNAENAACAVAAAVAAGVAPGDAVKALGQVKPPPMRGQIVDIGGRHVLLDCYNANPSSMAAALRTLAELRGTAQAAAVLGDMLELGPDADSYHVDVGRLAYELDIVVIPLGEHRKNLLYGGGRYIKDINLDITEPTGAARAALAYLQPGDWLLIKGSRAMRLERVAEAMRALTRDSEA